MSKAPFVKLSRDSHLPVYYQIGAQLSEAIRRGALLPGARLPSELQLARDLGVSAMTVRQAYGELARTGLVTRRHGAGTFVNRTPPAGACAAEPAPGKYTRDVAVLLNRLEQSMPFFAPIIMGMADAGNRLGCQVHIIGTNRQTISGGRNVLLRNLITTRQLDGIVFGGYFASADARLLDQLRIPYVLLDNDYGAGVPSVLIDDARAVTHAVGRLLKEGHRRIALLAGPPGEDPHPIRRGRKMARAFEEALAAHGPAPDPRYVRFADQTEAAAEEAVAELLKLAPRPTALLVAGDPLATGARRAARRCGVRVPEELALAVYADSEEQPGAVAVKPLREMGEQAVGMLAREMDGKPAPRGGRCRVLRPALL